MMSWIEPCGVNVVRNKCMVSAIHGSVGSNVCEKSVAPIFSRSDFAMRSLTRPMVKCGLKPRLSLVNPWSAIASSTFSCRLANGSISPSTPAHRTLGSRWLGNTPRPARLNENLDDSSPIRHNDSRIPPVRSESMLPKNFRVKWIPWGSTQRAPRGIGVHKQSITPESAERAGSEISSAMKTRIVSLAVICLPVHPVIFQDGGTIRKGCPRNKRRWPGWGWA